MTLWGTDGTAGWISGQRGQAWGDMLGGDCLIGKTVHFRPYNWVSWKLQRVWLIKQNTSSPHFPFREHLYPKHVPWHHFRAVFLSRALCSPRRDALTFPQLFKFTALLRLSRQTQRQPLLSRGHCELEDVTASVRDLLRLTWERVRLQLPRCLLFPFPVLYHFGSFELYMAFYLSQSFAGSKTRTFPVFPLTVIRSWLSKLGLP